MEKKGKVAKAAVKGRKGFQKGKSGNPKGRRKGTPNRTTKELREKIALIVADKLEQFDEIFEIASPRTKLETISALIKYVVPTLSKAEVDAAVNGDMKITVLFADKIAPTSEEA